MSIDRRAARRSRVNTVVLVLAIGTILDHVPPFGGGADSTDLAAHAHESSAQIDVEVGRIDATSLRWLGALEPAALDRSQPEPARVRIDVAGGAGDTRGELVAIRVSDRFLAPAPSRFVTRGSSLRVDDRWVVEVDPPGAGFRVFPPGGAPCGDDGRVCALAVAGRGGAWRVELLDELASSAASARTDAQ